MYQAIVRNLRESRSAFLLALFYRQEATTSGDGKSTSSKEVDDLHKAQCTCKRESRQTKVGKITFLALSSSIRGFTCSRSKCTGVTTIIAKSR